MDSRCGGIFDNVLETIGMTPMIRLNRFGAEYPAEICAKVEFFNPGGSIKDRIAFRMIKKAEESGQIKPGDYLIEPTSGNTGIGLAMAGAVLGYKVIIVMPQKMSSEKHLTMEALGAQVIRSANGELKESPNSNFGIAERLQKHLPNAHILQQFYNPNNPAAHYETTAEEIWSQTDGKIDYFVAGAGTGGTLTGCGRKLKEKNPGIEIVGVDPVGSILGGGDAVAPYQVEGIGYDFIPGTLDKSVVDTWIKVDDEDAFHAAMRIMRMEGLLIGGSCGSALVGAIEVAKRAKEGERIVVVLPDSIRNYLTKFVCNNWMGSYGFAAHCKNQYIDWNELQNHV
jgi:cysteine synthase